MITVPSQEIAAFLGNHLDHVLQRTGTNFLSSVAADREFKAGCAIMDVLNAVESVQESLRLLLEKKPSKGGKFERQNLEVRVVSLYLLHCLYSYLPIQQNPFLCLFVDIYNLATQDESLKSERFVTSVILNGDGEELAPSTPSELIAIAQEAESKPVNLGLLEEYLPEVPIEDQVKVGLGWDSAGADPKRGDRKRVWETFTMGSRQGDESDPFPIALPTSPQYKASSDPLSLAENRGDSTEVTGPKESNGNSGQGQAVKEEDEELEEWEIEAEKRFQDSDEDEPAPTPAPAKKMAEKKAEAPVNRQQLNAVMEQAAAQPLSFDQEQFMLSQFTSSNGAHIPLPSPSAIPGMVDNNPTVAFNLLLHLIQLSKNSDGQSQGNNTGSSFADEYLDTMLYSKRLTLHSLEVVNRLTGVTTLSPTFLHGYIENAVRCCEAVEDKVGQARVVRMLCVFLQSLLRNGAVTIPDYYHVLQNFCIQFSRVKEVANLFQTLMEYQQEERVDNENRPSTSQRSLSEAALRRSKQGVAISRAAPLSSTSPASSPADHQQKQVQQAPVQKSAWMTHSGSIGHVKSGVLSQFIHPGPGVASSSSGSGAGSGSFIRSHQKRASQNVTSVSSSSPSILPTIKSASISVFNSGLGGSGSSSLAGRSLNPPGGGGGFGGNGIGASEKDYDLEAALRASLNDMEGIGGPLPLNGSASTRRSGSSDTSGAASSAGSRTSRTPTNGLQQQQPHLAFPPVGGKHAQGSGPFILQGRGRGVRRGG